MLFPRRNHAVKTFVVVNNNVPKNMSVLCHSKTHILPVAMRFRRVSHTRSGVPTAEYCCDLCKKKQGWIYDAATGRPKLLWYRNNG